MKNSGRFFPGRFDLGRNVSYRIVRRFIPIDLSWWDVSYLYIYFLWEFFCIHSDIIINVTTKEVDELKIYKYYVYKTRVVPWPSLFLVRFPKCRCRSGLVSREPRWIRPCIKTPCVFSHLYLSVCVFKECSYMWDNL